MGGRNDDQVVGMTYASLQYKIELLGVKICLSQVAQNCRKLAAMSDCACSALVPIDDLAPLFVGVVLDVDFFNGEDRRDLLFSVPLS
jgi:hypothetical protein